MALLLNTDEALLSTIADRVVNAVATSRELTLEDGTVVQLHVTIGGTILLPGESLETLLHKADAALYAAKANGRNQYLIHHDVDVAP